MIFIKSLIVSFILLAVSSPPDKTTIGYNFNKPSISVVLPEILHEVSGLTIIDSSTIACIQDESGTLFLYDLEGRKIKKQYPLLSDGDYEGITHVNNTIYILRSDGMLFEVTDYQGKPKIQNHLTGIPATNNEGLCYDRDNNRLLIACKSQTGSGAAFKNKREVYAFDLLAKKTILSPVFVFDVNEIKSFAEENHINLPTKLKKKGQSLENVLKFRTSEIAIHPITKKLYLLSAADHMLFIFNMEGKIEHIENLNAAMFNKAEGISFFENGDMLISNEGQMGVPTLLRFNYKL